MNEKTIIHFTEWHSWVYWPDCPFNTEHEKMFRDTDALKGACAENEIAVPDSVYGTSKKPLKICAENALEVATEDHYDDAYDDIPKEAIDDLQALLDAWCARPDVAIVSYQEDVSTVIDMKPKGSAP